MKLKVLEDRLKDRIWRYAKMHFYPHRIKDSPLVRNLNYDNIVNQKRALVCYTPGYYFQSIDLKSAVRTIPFEIFKLVKILSELGYCIDIISVNDLKALDFVKSTDYSLIFGFGETFYQITQLQPDALSVYYVTENHPEFSYREEKKRVDYFFERHGRKVSLERSGRYYKTEHLTVKYDHIIVLGDIKHFANQYNKPFTIFPTGFINSFFVFKQKDHFSARKNFLWLGSTAVIHKGLDLLLDVASERDDITLHICGLDQVARELLVLPSRGNIIDYGFISINSSVFLEIVDKCSFSILPSCSEGMATSITTSMLHGLIPVVMKNTGFDRLEDFAIFLDDYKVDYLNTVISRLSEYDPTELQSFSERIQVFASMNFTLEAYEKRLRSIFSDIFER